MLLSIRRTLKKAKLHLSVAVLYFPTGMPLVAQPAVANLLRWQRDGVRRQAASCEAGWPERRHTSTNRSSVNQSINQTVNHFISWQMYRGKKVAHTPLSSVGFRSWSRFWAVSLHVTRVINPAVGCHYFPPGLQLPSQPLRGLLPISLLCEERNDGLLDCVAAAIWTTAPESSTLTTRLPSHTRIGE